MNLTEGLLIVIIIILIVTIIMRKNAGVNNTNVTREWDCVDKKSGDMTSVKMQYSGPGLNGGAHGTGCKCPKCSSPEVNTIKEHAEFFSGGCGEDATQVLHNMCGDGDFAYATNAFGRPDLSFKDFIMSEAVDTAVIKNHSEFVKDRLGNNTQNITGRTYAIPDRYIEGDFQKWVGLRRPEATSVCNPDTVNDVPYDWFLTKPKFTWSSS